MSKRLNLGSLLMTTFLVCALSTSCAGRRDVKSRGIHSSENSVALYKARVTDAQGEHRSFRLHILAALPDLFHAEIVAPVGGTRLIVDGGRRKLAVTVVPEKTAFVGSSSRKAMMQVFGIDISLGSLVRLLLKGEPPGTEISFRREPPESEGYPELLEIDASGIGIRMELKRIRSAPDSDFASLCTGHPPSGVKVLSLSELDGLEGPLLFPVEGGAK